MATDSEHIGLTEEQRKLLAELADRTGKPWATVLGEALALYGARAETAHENGHEGRSLFDALDRKGLIGCLSGGPPDLSTNPKHMEGFGAGDH